MLFRSGKKKKKPTNIKLKKVKIKNKIKKVRSWVSWVESGWLAKKGKSCVGLFFIWVKKNSSLNRVKKFQLVLSCLSLIFTIQ